MAARTSGGREKIEQVKAETSNTLDRILQTAQGTSVVAAETEAALHDQGKKLADIRGDLSSTSKQLDQTNYKLKHGFGWKGVFYRRKKAAQASKEISEETPVVERSAAAASRRPAAAPSSGQEFAKGSGVQSNENKPDGFDDKLDAIDALVSSMAMTAESINRELNEQSAQLDATSTTVVAVDEKAKSQSKGMARRFKLKG
jgi:ABC-type transporter Mla subunit MlaD